MGTTCGACSEFEPQLADDWENAPIRLRYRFELLPPGLLPRFIVKTHGLSDGSPHWRRGVVLRHADAKALIREESDQNALHVFVIGGAGETRQVLVAMVRRELETLHAEMKMQPAEELEISGDSDQWISVKALRDIEAPDRPTQRLPVQPEGTAEVAVSRELDKLVPPEVRAVDRDPDTAPAPVRLFVSYAREDERQLKRLDLLLDVLEQQHGLTAWRDQRLIAGDEWDAQIRERLEEMDIFLFIASAASIVRPYIRDPEIRRALERHAKGEVEIATVKLEPCGYDDIKELGTLQRLARRYDSIADAEPRSRGWEEVRKDLEPVIQRARDKRASRRRAAR